ncbi:MAG: hypothetical protein IKV25_05980 [Clostridia bacterium]|nr:hypothetical protein [Clostridia bacterium]
MEKQPRILVITVASWNSKVGSNTWTSLLKNYDSENIANICIRDEVPDNKICSRYFAISENKVLKSIFKRNLKTGREVLPETAQDSVKDLDEHNERYQKMQKKRRYSLLLARELVWKLGNWKTAELDAFLDSFKPDIILHSMEGYIHLNDIVEYAIKRTGAKAIGYIWDDNFTYKQSDETGFKIYRFFQRISLRRLAKKTSGFFAISDMTKEDADKFFGINCVVLTKPLLVKPVVNYGEIVMPIKAVYTGNLMIGRDRTLARIVKAAEEINKDNIKIKFDIYTKTALSEDIKSVLNCEYSQVHEPVPQEKAIEIQRNSDMLLFVEDIDGKEAKAARLSFSTKITDYLSSGKCIFAVGCRETAPMQYFIKNDAAVIATDDRDIKEKLEMIVNNPNLLIQYAEKSCKAGIENHSEEKIFEIFDGVIKSVL